MKPRLYKQVETSEPNSKLYEWYDAVNGTLLQIKVEVNALDAVVSIRMSEGILRSEESARKSIDDLSFAYYGGHGLEYIKVLSDAINHEN